MASSTAKEAVETTIRVVTFTGKKADWVIWDERFLARARRRGYKDILLGKNADSIPPDLGKLDANKEEDKTKIRLRQLNELAFDDIILSMEPSTAAGKVAFNIVWSAKTTEHPDGKNCPYVNEITQDVLRVEIEKECRSGYLYH